MAATPFDHPVPGASFFNIYNDGAVLLPSGPCNFINLNPGANGARCGCRRFWVPPDGPQPEMCACEHHACFHDDVRADFTSAPFADNPGSGQENEKPKTGRDPLSPVVPQEASFQAPSISGAMDAHPANGPTPSTRHLGGIDDTLRGSEGTPHPADQEPSIPDTMNWGNFLQSQAQGQAGLPAIPSQCLLASQATSVTSSVQRYLRPFAGKGLNTLSSVNKARDPLQEKEVHGPPPNGHGTLPDAPPHGTNHASQQPSPVATGPRQPLVPIEGVDKETFKKLSETVSGHDQRIDRLENISFSATGHEECQEKHESTDLRVTELESRMDEVEKGLNDGPGPSGGNRNVDESASIVSIATASTNNTVRHAEIYSQLQSLRADLSQLSSLSPTARSPWEIEVVFLPFPLKGIWMERSEFQPPRNSGANADFQTDQWTQMPSSYSVSAMPFHSPRFHDWAPQDPDVDWLLPRACAPDRLVDKRLRSRGLIKKVAVKGPDARSVHLAVSTAFGDMFRIFESPPVCARRLSNPDPRSAKYMGLQEPWVPLRKIHKESRLRFLTPAEMITSALWDFTFLSSSVTMKATSLQRLYITQPGAYLQDRDAYEDGWTWQRIREMARVYPERDADSRDGQTKGVFSRPPEVPEADAKEDCWEWVSKLDATDTPTSSQSGLSLRQSRHRPAGAAPNESSQGFYTVREYPSLSSSRSSQTHGHGHPQHQGYARKTPVRPPHIRTTSMPPLAPEMMSPAMRRRVASSGFYERRASPVPQRAMAAVVKRKSSRSPSVRPRNTPRWSTTSPSPVLEMQPRAVTPFCYATPYSNAPYEHSRRGPSVGPGAPVGQQVQQRYRDVSVVPMDDEYEHDGGIEVDVDVEVDVDDGTPTDPFDDTDMTQPDDVDENGWVHAVHPHHQRPRQNSVRHPEDDPWPGLPDHPMSDSENVDPLSAHAEDGDDGEGAGGDGASEASSQPSEYPSTQSAWRNGAGNTTTGGEEIDFRIHEDDDGIGAAGA